MIDIVGGESGVTLLVMFGKIDRAKILTSHSEIRRQYLVRLQQDLSDHTKRHLHRGFLVRLNMMEEALITLDDEIRKAQVPLSSYLATRLTLLLNAYYLNLVGSLDNLAWALTYHQNLLTTNVDENDKKHRRFAHLVGEKFLEALQQKQLHQLVSGVKSLRDWYWEVREFRDPAAHRIPLLVPTAVFSETDVRQYQDLDKEAADLISNGEWRKGMNLLRQSHQLGEYMPIFISETVDIKLYDLAGRVDQDHENWLTISRLVFEFGF
jgi:hypothetical protein